MADHRITALLTTMQTLLAELERHRDARRFFHATYLRTTRAVADELARGGFADGDWVSRWDVAFAQLYLDALAADRAGGTGPGGPVAQPWRVAFDTARRRPDLPPLLHVLLGLNAHINYDLPQSLLAVIPPAEFADGRLLALRGADHRHVDRVLSARVAAEDAELSRISRVRAVDRLLRPANRAASRRFLAEARAKVWRNAYALDAARRVGPQRYARTLAELERRCGERVHDLAAPGPVLINLARRGFGVLLPDA